jgi:hypothetical protein
LESDGDKALSFCHFHKEQQEREGCQPRGQGDYRSLYFRGSAKFPDVCDEISAGCRAQLFQKKNARICVLTDIELRGGGKNHRGKLNRSSVQLHDSVVGAIRIDGELCLQGVRPDVAQGGFPDCALSGRDEEGLCVLGERARGIEFHARDGSPSGHLKRAMGARM